MDTGAADPTWTETVSLAADMAELGAFAAICAGLVAAARRRGDAFTAPAAWGLVAIGAAGVAVHAAAVLGIVSGAGLPAAAVRALDAALLAGVALILWRLIERYRPTPPARLLAERNAALDAEIARRREAEARLAAATRELERRVGERTAELERANEALNRFAAAAAHDLQSPLRHIRLNAELLSRSAGSRLEAGERERLGAVMDAARRMHRLTDVLLQYAQLAGSPPTMAPVDLDAALDETLAARAGELDAAGAEIARAPLPTVLGDRVLLGQVIDNLVSNAVKHRGAAPLRLHLDAEPLGEDRVRVQVCDNGPGVSEADAQEIFRMLSRGDAAGGAGSGIGLALCRQIARSHGGDLSVAASPSGGACFRLDLPVAVAEPGDPSVTRAEGDAA